MNHQPEIAIVEANTLTSLGLKGILEEMIPMATIRTFHQFSELMDDTPDMYAHYFISAQIYVEHNAFFLPRKRKTIVLASDSPQFQLSGVPVLNIHESEEEPDHRYHSPEKYHREIRHQVRLRTDYLCGNERVYRSGPNLIHHRGRRGHRG